ncbi:hypothetical protein [Atlantibacter hermannii]|uniref:Uncharacterized protein n=1 Tax=Atlantibacter hermannii NBRC 105704 TaxID=1115512 RepID=H5UWC6_ATLHE|nr:hypothetical protein [Atlantibacter hermannii]QPS90149.1 hypothetical protein I6G45_11270 [Atlantibacter hermannii]GAB50207.1 hypothetical protein EH105704_01_02120 [Atlantibacter hermannii NBRC 105704]VDZ73020.1 Uncharacterised protein [Atlantibacter hermannii]
MQLSFDVSFPTQDIRITPGYAEEIRNSFSFTAGVVKTLKVKVVVKGLTSDKCDDTMLVINYSEDYLDKCSFGEVINRAEQYARNYCRNLGLGAT